MYHNPVMLEECLAGLNINPEGTYVDVTFGGGGHSRAILSKLTTGKLYAFDQDSDAAANVPNDERFCLIPHNFKHLKRFLKFHQALPVDGILGDLGVSSHQFDVPERGFSIRFEAELDMRMNTQDPLTAKDIINDYDEKQLQSIFYTYGEITNARKLAQTLISQRAQQPIYTVNQLKQAISGCVVKSKETQYLAQVFQALRIEVNQELEVLKDLLTQSVEVLKPGGRLVVMSYHSLEDRLVKHYMQKGKFEGEIEKDLYGRPVEQAPFKIINKKPIEASDTELKENPRSRSAKLRIAEKI